TRAITAESAVTYFAEIPVKSPNEKSYVRAFLGLTAQDIGPFIPKDIFVFVTKGNRILAVQSPAATEITEIPQCKNEWERFARKKSDADEVYRSSGLTNEKRSMKEFNTLSSKDSRHTSAVTTERQRTKNSSLLLRSRPNRLLIVC